jgi:hypothetical protein
MSALQGSQISVEKDHFVVTMESLIIPHLSPDPSLLPLFSGISSPSCSFIKKYESIIKPFHSQG